MAIFTKYLSFGPKKVLKNFGAAFDTTFKNELKKLR
jgi:hypothetical protein